jgi:D-alanyl-D-alanine carboxypeptidase
MSGPSAGRKAGAADERRSAGVRCSHPFRLTRAADERGRMQGRGGSFSASARGLSSTGAAHSLSPAAPPARITIRMPTPTSPRLATRVAISATAVALLSGQALAQDAGRTAADRPRVVRTIDSLATAALRDGPIAGLSVAVVRGSDTLVMKGYGYADLEHDVAATAHTVYRIGSITKEFTAAAVMQLVEQGRIGLDDSLAKHLPDVPAAWRPVTIRQLLNHTSGIRSYTSAGPKWAAVRRLDMSPDSILGLVRGDTLDFAPGTRWLYNNSGYMLLGLVIEKVSGRPYGEYVTERLFTPLGLSSTLYCESRPLIKHRADGYEPVGNRFVNAEFLSMTHPFSAGALCSSVRDLVKWQRALAGGRVVSAASYGRMSTPDTVRGGRRLNYGFGLMADTLGSHRMVYHGGGINGFVSDAAHFAEDSLTVVVLSNTLPSNPAALGRNIARAVLGIPLVAPRARPRDLPLTAQERARYLGTYTLKLPNGNTLALRVFEQDGLLLSQATNQPTIRLYSQGNHAFSVDFDPNARLTFTVEGDRATRLTLLQGGASMVGERVK